MDRDPGLSVRLKLTLSYAGLLMLAGALVLVAVAFFLLRYVPRYEFVIAHPGAFPRPGPGRRALLDDFVPAEAVALGVLLLFGLAGGWILAGRMLAPLTRINEATRIAATGSLSHRIRLPGRRDEFRELADAFDSMLARLEAHTAQQRRFAANASHELRTPLAITRTLLDVARRDPELDTAALIDRLQTVNTRAVDLTEALLILSRSDQRSFTRELVDISLMVEEAAETLLPLAEKYGVTIETTCDVALVAGSPTLLLQLVTNLIQNGIVHNLGRGGIVWVTARRQHGWILLGVDNTGERLQPEVVATLAEPFRRGTERLRSDQAGVGLGLAIVRSIAQAHDGELRLAPRAAGGLSVQVELPS